MLGEGGFEPYIRAVRRHPLIVALATLAAVLGAGAWLVVRTVDYRATAEVLVTPLPSDDFYYLGLPILRDFPADPARVFQTAAAMIDSPSAAVLSAQRLGRGWSPERVRAALTVEPMGESHVVAVQVRARDPGLAARIANTFVQAALQVRSTLLRSQATALLARLGRKSALPPLELDSLRAVSRGVDPMLSLLHLAAPAVAPAASPAWRVLVLSLVPGLVLGIAIALLIEVFTRRVQPASERVEFGHPRSKTPTP